MSFLLLIFNIFLNCNRKWGIIVKIGVVIGGKKTIIGGRRGNNWDKQRRQGADRRM